MTIEEREEYEQHIKQGTVRPGWLSAQLRRMAALRRWPADGAEQSTPASPPPPPQVVFAGVDYEAILRQAEAEADVVIWDGAPWARAGLCSMSAGSREQGQQGGTGGCAGGSSALQACLPSPLAALLLSTLDTTPRRQQRCALL